ncbi:MAG: alpha-hydroxy-acid oxidizing protein [Proteobacteria bacterium]|uniref:alpha-hydroxy acid oxidase n=1 Tax=Aquabacterium sp. TaxID=1872578 RepID=UPI0035C755D7|nr:alpha-hydroxy-acid oxidizing protein [Pseudomonadota bacterium]
MTPDPTDHGLQAIPADTVSLADYQRHAAQRMDAAAWAYLQGGAGDEQTVAANAQAWQALQLLPRVLRRTADGHTRTELLGRTLAHPLIVAPVAYQRLAHPEGELDTALAAAAQEAGFVLSTQSSTSLEDIADAVAADDFRGPLWMQLYLQPDRDFTRTLLRRAEGAGFEAIVLTVDAPVSGTRDRERRANFRLPAGVSAMNLHGMRPAPARELGPQDSALFNDLLHHAPTWDDVAWLQSQTRLPVLLKGVLRADDARQARALGVQGLIVSNHGGRTLDTVLPTARALPRIVEAVGDDLPVLVDGGIRRGTDVLKALALGARAVLIGRPCVHALATAGALGVAHALRLLRDELEAAMALSGCATLADIGPDLIDRD